MKKKLLLSILALLTVLALCACNQNPGETQPGTDPVQETTLPTEETTLPTEETTLPSQETTENTTDPTQETTVEPTQEATDPTEPEQTQTPTEPEQTTEPQTEPPTQLSTDPSLVEVTYYDYYFLFTAEQQEAFINSFDSIEDFFAWNKQAKEDYESGRIPIDDSGIIDLG